MDTLTSLRRFLRDLETGACWSDALDRHHIRLTGEPPAPWPPAEGRVTWHWLTDLDQYDAALDLGSELGDVTEHLRRAFARVTSLYGSGLEGEIVAARFQGSADAHRVLREDAPTIAPGSYDLAVFEASAGWDERIPASLRHPRALVAAAHRSLRLGGWFACLAPTAISLYGVPADARTVLRSFRLSRALRGAMAGVGFSASRRYLVLPATGAPITIVPATRSAMRAWRSVEQLSHGIAKYLPAAMTPLTFPRELHLAQR